MLKLDILVPVILILCLLALAYILSKVFSPAAAETPGRTNTEIVLDEDRYREDEDLGTATNPDDRPANVSNTTDELNDYYQDDSNGTISGDEDDDDGTAYYDEDAGNTTTTTAPAPSITSTERTVRRGDYHVIAGSFRQKIYAEQMVRDLKRDGFTDAYLGYTNRGAYAVAVVGSTSAFNAAKTMERRAESLGYSDTFVNQ